MKPHLSPETYELFAVASHDFYDTPERLADSHCWFGAAERLAPDGWVKAIDRLWVALTPVEPELPCQGWKIHVSVGSQQAEHVIDVVWAYCVGAGLPFKFLRSRTAVDLVNAKHANRASSGKVITVYAGAAEALTAALRALGPQLCGIPGAYILSDLRHGDGPLFVRYGAFREMWCIDEHGERVPAIRTPEGDLVADRRVPSFTLPAFVTVPEILVADLQRRASEVSEEFPYTIERAIHFSNAGGRYLARRGSDGRSVLVREARPHAATDANGHDAVTRLQHEKEMLARLEGLDCVPESIGYHIVWEHHFLIEEYIEGETLLEAIIARHPLVHPAPSPSDLAAYVDWVDSVVTKVEDALAAVHARGISFGDLHPGNVMLRPDGRVVLIDWELAGELGEPARGGAPGFVPADRVDGIEADGHALACLRLMALVPLVALLDRDPAKVSTLCDAACEELALSRRQRRRLRGAAWAPIGAERDDRAAGMFANDPLDWPSIRASLVAGIHAVATPERADRLFPGDPLQFSRGGAGIAYGAAGVLLALCAAGEPVPDAYVDWLERAADRPTTATGAGLYDGPHGVALVLDRLGRRDRALELLTRAGDGDDVREPGLFGGRAGIALNQLHFARQTADERIRSSAMDLADDLARLTESQRQPFPLPGLFTGMTGPALLFLHLYVEAGDVRYLDLASAALRQDLERCVLLGNGSLYVRQGTRHLPYLARGTAGIAVVLRQLLRRRPDDELSCALAAIHRACRAPLVLHPGLFEGRAGLIAALREGDPTADARPVVAGHIRRLGWHALEHAGHLAFPGHRMRRLSLDLATGSAGVLLALQRALTPDSDFLPYLDLGQPRVAKGGEACLPS